jgi:hypothetical protein
VQKEITASAPIDVEYISVLDSSVRDLGQPENYQRLFTTLPKTYDAFDKDIAMVKIVYQVWIRIS